MGGGSSKSREQLERRVEKAERQRMQEYERERNLLMQLDSRTRVPHLLIELRNLGFVEVQGKDIGGIYEKLDAWLKKTWRASNLAHDIVDACREDTDCCCIKQIAVKKQLGKMEEWNRLCDRSWVCGDMMTFANGMVLGNGTFKARGVEGENNMGKLTMQLVEFMTTECGWTFQTCDSGNLGWAGEIREQQIKFKAPHPLNMIAPHIMIELRQVGYIEINGPNTNGIYGKLSEFFKSKWSASPTPSDPDYCDLKFRMSGFKQRGSEGENNMGMRTMELVDFMVKQCQWTMVTCNGGNHGRKGDEREQQLVFRNDEFVQHGADHVMVELRTGGYVELNGMHDTQDLQPALDCFLKDTWGCTDYKPRLLESGELFCDHKYTTPENFFLIGCNKVGGPTLTNNLGKRTLQLAEFMATQGWALHLCNGGSMQPDPANLPWIILREQQVKFTRAKSAEKAAEPLLLIQLRTVPLGARPPCWHGIIEVHGKDTNGVYEKLHKFFKKHMGAVHQGGGADHYCDRKYSTDIFRLKECHLFPNRRREGCLNGESNIGKWTMRLCDFLVDHVGEWDLIVCNSDNLSAQVDEGASVTAREMQLVFRHRKGGRAVFMTEAHVAPLGRPPLQPPAYWSPEACAGTVGHKIVPGTAEELAWIQEILDKTFKHKATRDRGAEHELADRFVVVSCLRSEQPALWDAFAGRRKMVMQARRGMEGDFVEPKTMQCQGLAGRCRHPTLGNPANVAYLLHGTNPTSAVAILGRDFSVNLAGKGVGTMFGPGVYLAESSTKADEYARDDVGGEYDGLYAVLVCRAVLGRSFVAEKPGNYAEQVTSGEYDHVLGDREKAVGTFREFVLFHEESIYPEFAAFYRREKGGKLIEPKREVEAVAPPQQHLSI